MIYLIVWVPLQKISLDRMLHLTFGGNTTKNLVFTKYTSSCPFSQAGWNKRAAWKCPLPLIYLE